MSTDDNPTGRTTHRAPELQPVILGPSSGGIEPSREAFYHYRHLAKHFNFATGDSYSVSQQTVNVLQDAAHDETYVRNIVCDYASIEYGMLRSHQHGKSLHGISELLRTIGPRAPKRKRRKRLAKKQRGGMLKTCGVVQSYFDAWPAMRGWFA